MENNKLATGVNWLVENWEKIPDKFKISLRPDSYYSGTASIPSLDVEEHIVVLLLSRQKPSRMRDYDFDEERIGVTSTGKIVYGFDSGCSCPSPWYDNYPKCYNVEKTWKQFTLKTEGFDTNWAEECLSSIEDIKRAVNGN